MLKLNELYLGDCLEVMKDIDDNSIDMILCDLPYKVTNFRLDKLIPFKPLWELYERIIKINGVICLFGQDKFTANMVVFKQDLHRYNLVWKKGNRVTGFLNAKKRPLKNHEDIMIFYKKQPVYNPQFSIGTPLHSKGKRFINNKNRGLAGVYNRWVDKDFEDYRKGSKKKYPISVLNFDKPHPQLMPFQKPVLLCEWLIKTFTKEGMLILDNAIGTGTTAIAAMNLSRNWIGIEKDFETFKIANERIKTYKDNNLWYKMGINQD